MYKHILQRTHKEPPRHCTLCFQRAKRKVTPMGYTQFGTRRCRADVVRVTQPPAGVRYLRIKEDISILPCLNEKSLGSPSASSARRVRAAPRDTGRAAALRPRRAAPAVPPAPRARHAQRGQGPRLLPSSAAQPASCNTKISSFSQTELENNGK